MIVVNIMLGLVAAVLLLGVIGEKDKERQRSITLAFVVVLAFTACANTIF